MVKASNIKHDNVEFGVVSGRPSEVGVIVDDYYGLLVHLNLTTQKQVYKTYCDGIMFVAVKDFTKWAY